VISIQVDLFQASLALTFFSVLTSIALIAQELPKPLEPINPAIALQSDDCRRFYFVLRCIF
jgi:hypothetical protein